MLSYTPLSIIVSISSNEAALGAIGLCPELLAVSFDRNQRSVSAEYTTHKREREKSIRRQQA